MKGFEVGDTVIVRPDSLNSWLSDPVYNYGFARHITPGKKYTITATVRHGEIINFIGDNGEIRQLGIKHFKPVITLRSPNASSYKQWEKSIA